VAEVQLWGVLGLMVASLSLQSVCAGVDGQFERVLGGPEQPIVHVFVQ
jgi:hypothetical protein